MKTIRRWSPQFTIPLIAALLTLLALFFLASLLGTAWPPSVSCATAECKEAREWISSTVTAIVIFAGLYQYWQAQQWKRAEFVAGEMLAFFSLPSVRKAMLMVDWGTRHVNLFDTASTDPRTWPLVSRRLQSDALLPHPLRQRAPRDLRPYLGYWIDDIASPTTDASDGEWACSLLAYIAFYRYTGVQALFRGFGHDITPQGRLFTGFLRQVP